MLIEISNALATVITADTQRGNGNGVDAKVYPKSIGIMGLSPSDVEMTGVVVSKKKIDSYLKRFPKRERARIEAEMFKQSEETDRIRNADLVF